MMEYDGSDDFPKFKCTWFLGETMLILGGVKIVACSVKRRWFEQKLLDGGIFYPIVFQMHTWSGERSFGSDFWWSEMSSD